MKRREFLQRLAAGATLLALPHAGRANPAPRLARIIPSSGERIPAIGMGTWQSFDVGGDDDAIAARCRLLREFVALGGGMIDSSPMYGASELVLGRCLATLNAPATMFSATKVWIYGRAFGVQQMDKSRALWGLPRFDLMQIHNMLDWETHLETLRQHQAEGRIRYIGITTSHGRRHDELERALSRERFDFVQLTYNIADREPEQRLLPLARERGIAVIANRPFRRGALFDAVKGHTLPAWAADIDCTTWAQFFLKFIISHPDITCAIPATTRSHHLAENMNAAHGRQPDAAMRERMLRTFRDVAG